MSDSPGTGSEGWRRDAPDVPERHVLSVGPATTGATIAAPSTLDDRPADLVAQPLVIQDEFANRIRELFALPTALQRSRAFSCARGRRGTRSVDRVGPAPSSCAATCATAAVWPAANAA